MAEIEIDSATRLEEAPARFLDRFEELRMKLSTQQLIDEAIEINYARWARRRRLNATFYEVSGRRVTCPGKRHQSEDDEQRTERSEGKGAKRPCAGRSRGHNGAARAVRGLREDSETSAGPRAQAALALLMPASLHPWAR